MWRLMSARAHTAIGWAGLLALIATVSVFFLTAELKHRLALTAFQSAADNRIRAVEHELNTEVERLDGLLLVALQGSGADRAGLSGMVERTLPAGNRIVIAPLPAGALPDAILTNLHWNQVTLHQALAAAQRTGRVQATSGFSERGEARVLLVAVQAGPSHRRAFIVEAINVRDLVERAFRRLAPAGVDVAIYEADDRQSCLYYHASRLRSGHKPVALQQTSHGMQREIRFAGRAWTIAAEAVPGFLDGTRTWEPWTFAGATLIAAAFYIAWLRAMTARTVYAEQRVAERTAQLTALNRDLEEARDKALETSRLKSEFLQNVSHEVRTPLNGVLGTVALLHDTALTAEQRVYSELLHRSSKALLSVIDDILDMSRLEAGKLRIEARRFDFYDCLRSASELLAERVEAKGLTLTLTCEPDVPQFFSGDSTRVRQIVLNLLGNAVKFTDHGEVSLSVRLDGPERVRIEVRDTGPGVDPLVGQRILERFVQADGSTRRRHGGVGLGLSIARELVHCMGGELGFDSAVGHGSSFWFTLPLHEHERAPIPDLRDRRVLLATGSQPLLRILRPALEHTRAHVLVCESWKELDLARDMAEVIILDVSLLGPAADAPLAVRAINKALVLLHPLAHPLSYLPVPNSVRVPQPVASWRVLEETARALAGRTLGLAHETPWQLDLSRSPRILIVEDNEINQHVLVRSLGKLNCHTQIAPDGYRALALLAEHEFDLILMDCHMPLLDGFETTRCIRERPGQPYIPIVAVTATASSEAIERVRESGMDDLLTKPVRPEALRAILSRWLRPAHAPAPESVLQG